MTIKEIAELAGVSVASVSRTINNNGRVSPQVKQRILEVIEQYNYTPNAKGRFLRTNRTNMVLVSLSDFTNNFMNQLVSGIRSAAKEKGYEIVLIPMDLGPGWEDKCFAMLADKRFDGMIATYTMKNNEELAELNRKYPFVLLSECPEGADVSGVYTNNVQAGYDVVRHFLSCGHRQIGALSLSTIYPTAKWRLEGYKKALVEAGLPYELNQIILCGYQVEDGYLGCRELMERDDPPTAIFCYSDALAVGAVRYLVEHGLRPGVDVDIIGFDDLPFAQNYMPSISSVHHPGVEMGRSAFELLLERMNDLTTPTRTVMLPSKLVLRETTRG